MKPRKEVDYYIDENDCFICTSHYNNGRSGHINITRNGKTKQMARHIYEKYVGPVDGQLVTRHICDNPKCINPDHIEFGTNKENQEDKKRRNRVFRPIGEINGQTNLTEKQVRQIKYLIKNGYRNNEIATMLEMKPRTISGIRTGYRWSHVII